MKRGLMLMVSLLVLGQARGATDISPGLTFNDGDQLYASDLAKLVSQATINSEFVAGKTEIYALPYTAMLLVLDPAYSLYRKVSVQSALYGNTNLAAGLAPMLGTNYGVSHVYRQMFSPWSVFGTAGTNVWGGSSTFAITNLYMGGDATNAMLAAGDTFPVRSTFQGSNTVASLEAMYQYFTNRNTLPAYTQARIQFGGIPVSLQITNTDATANLIMVSGTGGWFATGQVYGVSFMMNPIAAALWTGMTSNTVFFVTPTNSGGRVFRVWSSYAAALTQSATNCVAVATVAAQKHSMLYLTNYTSFNADAVMLTAGLTTNTGNYNVFFRTNATSANYYVTAMALNTSNGRFVSYADDDLKTTNYFRLATYDVGSAFSNARRLEVLVTPE